MQETWATQVWSLGCNPLQYSCLENPTDSGAWRATVHGVAQSQTRLRQLGTAHFDYNHYYRGTFMRCIWKSYSQACSHPPPHPPVAISVLWILPLFVQTQKIKYFYFPPFLTKDDSCCYSAFVFAFNEILKKKFLLVYSWFIMLFQVYRKVTQLYMYIYPVCKFFSHILRVVSRAPCAIQWVP